MASDSIKKVQEKLFRGGNTNNDTEIPRSEPALTINIPGAPPTPTPPIAAPPKSSKALDQLPNNDQDARRQQDDRFYRERLASRIGADYKGVERYRLEQEERRERHWKRWGPYLSERQWVRATIPPPPVRPNVCVAHYNKSSSRLPFAKITRQMETHGPTFPTHKPDPELTDGVKTVSLEYLTITSAFALPSHFGMVKIQSSKSDSLGRPAIKATMAKTSRRSIIIWTLPPRILI